MQNHTGIALGMAGALLVIRRKGLKTWCVKKAGRLQLWESFLSKEFPYLIAVILSLKNFAEGASLCCWNSQSKRAEFTAL